MRNQTTAAITIMAATEPPTDAPTVTPILADSEAIPPDDSTFEILHVFARNAMPTESVVAEPIVKPLMVTVNADVGMAAPEIVMTTEVAEVSPHTAVNPGTLLAPELTVGTTPDAKKLAGNDNVNALPNVMRIEEEKTKVTGTDVLRETRFEVAIMKEENEIIGQ